MRKCLINVCAVLTRVGSGHIAESTSGGGCHFGGFLNALPAKRWEVLLRVPQALKVQDRREMSWGRWDRTTALTAWLAQVGLNLSLPIPRPLQPPATWTRLPFPFKHNLISMKKILLRPCFIEYCYWSARSELHCFLSGEKCATPFLRPIVIICSSLGAIFILHFVMYQFDDTYRRRKC